MARKVRDDDAIRKNELLIIVSPSRLFDLQVLLNLNDFIKFRLLLFIYVCLNAILNKCFIILYI